MYCYRLFFFNLRQRLYEKFYFVSDSTDNNQLEMHHGRNVAEVGKNRDPIDDNLEKQQHHDNSNNNIVANQQEKFAGNGKIFTSHFVLFSNFL